MEPHQQKLAERLTNIKFTVHFKDEYGNAVDFFSILFKQRRKQHELLCFLEPDGGSAELFFAFARYNNHRNLPLAVLSQYPHFVLNHEHSTIEDQSVLFSFAIHAGIC
jgi:hypothetical protein